jgi:site-specific DNA-methyltransferase (adenine-specific)
MENVKLIEDSCFNSEKYIKSNSVDMFFCDPPYNILDQEWDKQWKNNEEFYIWTKNWMKLMYNQLKLNGTAYICISWQHSYIFHKLLKELNFIILNRITWKRDKGRGSLKNWKSMHEDIFFIAKSNNYLFNIEDVKVIKKVIAPYKDEKGENKDWWYDDNKDKVRLTYPGNLWEDFCVPFWSSNEVKSYAKSKKSSDNLFQKHPTQKPKDLVKRCILASTNKNELVVDYFAGSGTTLIAAKELNRNCIGFEIDKNYCGMVKERLKNENNPQHYSSIKNNNKIKNNPNKSLAKPLL